MVMMAGVTTLRENTPHDPACILKEGDHPFISHPSFVEYRFARLESSDSIEAKVSSGEFLEREDCSPDLVRKIIAGALNSKRIPREYKLILEAVLFG